MCSITSSIRLPAFHHAYVEIQGPANTIAFVNTHQDLALDKLLSVAAGIVEFNKERFAPVKLANLDTSRVLINKGHLIASCEYLPSSHQLYSITSNTPSFSIPSVDTNIGRATEPTSLDFAYSIGSSLSVSEANALKGVLGEYSDCFATKAATVTPLVQHHIDTGDCGKSGG